MSGVIKNSETARATPFNFGDIAIEARSIIAAARQRAEALVADAQANADAIREQARSAGHAEGHAAGREEGLKVGRDEAQRRFDAEFARSGRMLAEAMEMLNERKGQMLAEARQDLVALALTAAEKVVRTRLAADPGACRRTVDAAVELTGHTSRLSIRVSPGDLATIQEFAPNLADRLTGEGEVQVVADESIEPGGCRVTAWRESGQSSEVDATIQTQLTRIAAELLGTREE
ncbi:MAG: hypothetical protein BIFFINMI_03036 [Phycisphaerae bacterium]|nr:hypothetical protein [Phycisphaerae bacterium]